MVFYRKYRPQTIEELDSLEVREKLSSVLSAKTIPHAFLFTGPKGLGKTSTARIVAKSVNCERKLKFKSQKSKAQVKIQKLDAKDQRPKASDQIEPCNKCYQCVSITNGTNIDVLEIDGASNRGIDEIRDLREKVRLAPAASKYKAYIIDEVHMLTPEAFNALLKTLEEPPPHVIFVLCTTEPQKVPQTILSRCFHIGFRRAKDLELIRSFVRIAKKEKIKIDKDALDLIAKLSDGSFRDGAKILEEMAGTFGRKKITKELIEAKLQITDYKLQITQMIELLAKRDTKGALKLVSALVKQGLDMKFFLEQLINELHLILLAQVGIPSVSAPSTSLTIGEIKELVGLLGRAHTELKYAVLPQLPLEMAIIEWSDKDIVGGADVADENFVSSPRPVNSVRIKSEGDLWQKLIEKVNVHNRSVAGVLRGCRLKSFAGERLTIEAGFKFHKDRLEEGKTKALIAKIYKEILGKDIGISVVLKGPA